MTKTAEKTKYTEQQITKHCDELESLVPLNLPEIELLRASVQIIKQLQSKQAELLLHDIFGPPTIADLKAENEDLREQLRALADKGN